jgi:hypothetical protein
VPAAGGGVEANPRLVGKGCHLLGPQHRRRARSMLGRPGPAWQSTHRVITRDGRTIWVRDEAVWSMTTPANPLLAGPELQHHRPDDGGT